MVERTINLPKTQTCDAFMVMDYEWVLHSFHLRKYIEIFQGFLNVFFYFGSFGVQVSVFMKK